MPERTIKRLTQMSQSKVVNLTPWDMLTLSTQSRSKSHALLERKDADAAIRGLSPLESYYTMKDLGPHDAIPYLTVIEGEQVCSLFDMDVWATDRLEISDLLIWFEAFREAGIERLQFAARQLDSETLALLLRRRLLIGLVTDDDVEDPPDWVQNPPPNIAPIVKTPDNRFFIAARTVDESEELNGGETPIDEEERKAVVQLVDDLYRDQDFEFVSSVLRMAETGLSSSFEEQSFRFRNARLEDLGFPPFARAIEVFSIMDLSKVFGGSSLEDRNSGNMRLPALHVQSVSEGYFVELMRTIEDAVLVRAIESELVPLANSILIAERIEINNLEAVKECLTLARHYLELALTYQNHGEDQDEIATKRLSNNDLKTLFRIGYTVAVKLKSRMKVISPDLLTENERQLWDSVQQRRPRIVDQEALLELLAAWEGAADIDLTVLEGDVLPPAEEQSLEVLVMTLAINIIGFRRSELHALSGKEISLVAQMLQDGSFPASDVGRVLASFHGTWRHRVEKGLERLAEELEPLRDSPEIDIRFLSGFVRRSGS